MHSAPWLSEEACAILSDYKKSQDTNMPSNLLYIGHVRDW